MGLSIPSVPATIASLTAEEVWDYATKNLTNPAAAQDLANMLPGISPTATGRAALLDYITAARLAELDPANIPGDIDTLLAVLTVHAATLGIHDVDVKALLQHATYGLSKLTRTTMLEVMEHEIEFPSNEVTQVITGNGNTTEQDITIAIPGGSIRRVVILALVTALNDSDTGPMKIDLEFQGKVSTDDWPEATTLWTQDDVIGFPAMEAATTSIVLVARPTPANDLITAAGTYNFRVVITNPTAGDIRYTTQYLVVITYRMS